MTMIGVAFIPDLANLISSEVTLRDMPLNWVAWLTLMQLSLAALCVVAVRMKRTKHTEVVVTAAALWFCLQALDELLAGNFFDLGIIVEYCIALVMCLGVWQYIRNNGSESA